MKIIVTGAAGFIGSALVLRLLERGDRVVGIDNHNGYYDPSLKEARIRRQLDHPCYTHVRGDIADFPATRRIFEKYEPQRVVNLAAHAGVRHSIDNPLAYIQVNVVGFANILECCRIHNVDHLTYASSSSVYGGNSAMPLSVHDSVNHPLSLYAATKRADELMAHAYSHLQGLPTTGLRFFSVYGPWGRPDMALFKFTRAILAGEPIQVFNNGNHNRDFTYIDDIVEGVVRVLDRPATADSAWRSDAPDPATSSSPWRIYNIGNNRSINLLDYIAVIETALGKRAELDFLPLQAGDIADSVAEVEDLVRDFGYRPSTTVDEGIRNFVSWYREYFNK